MKSFPEILQEMNEDNNEHAEEVIMLVKKNGVWQMDIFNHNGAKQAQGKELVIALMDTENPIAATFVDGEILEAQYNSLYVKFNDDKVVKNHNCFSATNEDIIGVLDNDGLVLALSPNHMPRTDKFNQYLEENNIDID